MSNKPEFEIDLDLHFLPSWAQQPAQNRFAKFTDVDDSRPPRRDDRGGGRPRPDQRGDRGDRRGGPGNRGPNRGPGGPRDRGDRGGDRFRREEPRKPAPLPDLEVSLVPEEKGVESLARQIRLTGRAYPIFDIGHLVLKKPDRYHVIFNVIKKADGQAAQSLWVCNLDDTVWLSEADAVHHVLSRHFDTFYKTEKIAAEPPKGTYTFVAQCGMSGVILGPPNYHDYQTKLRKLHSERFAHMPFENFKARVKIVRDEAVVKQWLDELSWKFEYDCLNLPEPKRLFSREEVEQHFRETHLPNIIRQVDSYNVTTPASRDALPGPLQALARRAWEDQKRFPLRIVTILSQQFASHGLQFFKVDKTVTHVAVSRPHFLDMEATPVSEGLAKIVHFIDANPGCNRRRLIEALAPTPATPAPAAPPAVPAEGAAPAASTEPTAPPPTPEQEALITNLHWLIHQGHVIEFANGKIETAKRPTPKPPKPEPQPKAAPAVQAPAPGGEAIPAATAPAPAGGEAPSAEAPVTIEAVPPASAGVTAAPAESPVSPVEPALETAPKQEVPGEQTPPPASA